MAAKKLDPNTTTTTDTTTASPETTATPPDPGTGEAPPPPVLAPPQAAPSTAPQAAPPVDVDALAEAATARVVANLDPLFRKIFNALEDLSEGQAQRPAPPSAAAKIVLPVDEVPAGEIADADIPYIAKNLTEAQLDRIIAQRRATGALAAAIAKGAIPGEHVIATRQIKVRLRGADATVKADDVIAIADLDPGALPSLRAAGHVIAPGELAA